MNDLQPDPAFNSRAPSPLDAKLPPPPPADIDEPLAPPPPAKQDTLPSLPPIQAPQALTLPPLGSLGAGLNAPLTPTTPTSPSATDGKSKRANPLTDLVDTEKAFVDQLTGIIRAIAAAWSRSNLPPPELDTMFRSIEGIYKANRGLHAKLKDISADPKSAGELGGLLIKWIDDLKKPYETYCSKYCSGFDTWQPVQSNSRLGPILAQFSSANPAPSNGGIWTLDSLFLLPKARLKYYLKLYNRLLKNTDNRLLIGAVETLNHLMDILDSRTSVKVGEQGSDAPAIPALETEDEIVIDMRNHTLSPSAPAKPPLRLADNDTNTGSETSSNRGSASGGERSSRESQATSTSRASTQTLSLPITDLERRLSTERTLDIFTMTSKAVKLQMAPASLTFTREFRTSLDVVIRFTPRATGVEVVHYQGHIFLLSDLFLICERMLPEDRDKRSSVGADMWLCYPPLAGKVLRVSEVPGQDNALQVAIMRKEYLILETDSMDSRNRLMTQFKECTEFSSSLPPPSKQPPPPVPSLSAFTGNHPASAPSIDPQTQGNAGPSELPPQPPAYPSSDGKPLPSPSEPRSRPETNLPPAPGPPYLRSSASAQPFPRGPPLGSNTIIPPARSTSYLPGTHGESSNGPNFPPANGMYGQGPGAYIGNPQGGPAPSTQQSMYPLHPVNGRPNFPPGALPPPRPPSEPNIGPGPIHKAPSIRSLGSQYSQGESFAPPLPRYPPGQSGPMNQGPRTTSYAGGMLAPQARPLLPSAQLGQRSVSMAAEIPFTEPSPPNSPLQEPQHIGPVVSTISAQMKCKVFLQQHHAQWKSLGSAKLKLYRQDPTNVKQLVVEADNKEKSVLISTIVLTDGVERVGKTGVAIELSDKGARTGIIYMIQLRNEASAGGLFDSLLAGSDRAARG
ncbi:hypothetical protein JR316_0000913 [Psilocybe cubensis]|uniref:Uncharacterized protein n=1 Tax=Psilocybe cubensis TaxID=181762 RepID=A0ACB8HG12_PSICU|nr:hypothetical protein JR316_0000913 [Psilocybe cubensis]KAH9486848.1 hypothetical protein JR316_0000913 [Psilocybe cubensis]